MHRLIARHRRAELEAREGPDIARAWHLAVADHLVQDGRPTSNYAPAAAHRDAAGDRAGALELYQRWALSLGRQHAYGASIDVAERGLARFPPGSDDPSRIVAARLWMRVHDGMVPLGDLEQADAALDESSRLLSGIAGEADFARGVLHGLRARRHITSGDLDAALNNFRVSADAFQRANADRERSIALGGQADIRMARGELDEALRIRSEQIPVFEELGDVDGKGNTLWAIAQVHIRRRAFQLAYQCLDEAYGIYIKHGRLEGICFVGLDLGQILAMGGHLEEGRTILERSRDGFARLGQPQMAARVADIPSQLPAA